MKQTLLPAAQLSLPAEVVELLKLPQRNDKSLLKVMANQLWAHFPKAFTFFWLFSEHSGPFECIAKRVSYESANRAC